MDDPVPSARWRHDLKNQLGIVIGFAELLLADPALARHRQDLEDILRAAHAALGLVNQLGEPDHG